MRDPIMNGLRWAARGLLLIELVSGSGTVLVAAAQNSPDTAAIRDSVDGRRLAAPDLAPHHDWPDPVNDRASYTFLLADVLEYRPRGGDSDDFRWDMEGWHGGDYNRVWFKSEGEKNTAFKADYDIDLQLLYGRFIWKYYDVQIGGRLETQTFRGDNVTRGLAVIGLQGLVPYSYEVESALFIDQDANISARLSATKELLITQRLILQPRIETSAAVQRVERFTTAPGLNDLELGVRLRYEIWRKFGPYVGFSFERSLFGTARLVREDGGDPSQTRFVAGARIWR